MSVDARPRLIGLLIMLALVIIFYVSGPPWDSPSGAAAIYSALAFLTMILSVSLLELQRIDDTPSNAVLAGTALTGFVVLGASSLINIAKSAPLAAHATTEGIFTNLVALTVAAVLLVAYVRLVGRQYPEDTWWTSMRIELLIVAVGSGVSLFGSVAVTSALPSDALVILGRGLGVTSVLCFALASGEVIRKRHSFRIIQPFRLFIAFAAMACAALVHTVIVSQPSSLWVISMGLLAMGFVYANVGVISPTLMEMGVSARRSYAFATVVQAIIVLPVVLTYVLNAYAPTSMIQNAPVSFLSHFAAAAMAGACTYLFYRRGTALLAHWHRPLAFLFMFWTVAEGTVAASLFLPWYGGNETIVPYLMGSLFTFVLLLSTYRHAVSPAAAGGEHWSLASVPIYVLAVVGVLVGTEGVRLAVSRVMRSSELGALESALMLGFAYLALYALLRLFYSMQIFYGGRLTFDASLAALNTVWVVVTILRANFAAWTIGWWTSELLLYSVATSSILQLVRTYARVVSESDELKERMLLEESVTLPALEEITALVSDYVEAMGSEKRDEERLELSAKALSGLSRAQSLLKSAQLIARRTPVPEEELSTIDLVDVLESIIRLDTFGCAAEFDTEHEEWLVKTDPAIADAIAGVLSLLLKRIGVIRSVHIRRVPELEKNRLRLLAVEIVIEVEAENARVKRDMLIRYASGLSQTGTALTQAMFIVEALGGNIGYAFEAESGNRLSVSIMLQLPTTRGSGTQREK